MRTLNDGTQAIQSFRADMDSEIGSAVSELNDLLGQFKDANNDIVVGHAQRPRRLRLARPARRAAQADIEHRRRLDLSRASDNDMVIMTKDGATLFETIPRTVSFQPQTVYAAGMAGNSVYIDGIPLQGGTGGNTNSSGKLAGLMQLRDSVAGTMQSQLDEVARGLVTAFAETDGSGGPLPPLAGLFTWAGAPAIPAAGTIVDGLAGTISLNAAFDSVGRRQPDAAARRRRQRRRLRRTTPAAAHPMPTC